MTSEIRISKSETDWNDQSVKGKILKKEAVEVFYVLISSKRNTDI
jgi:hypothetical protein